MAADQETVDRVRSIDVDAYKYGFISAIEFDLAPKGLSQDTVRFISAEERRAEMAAGLATGGFPPLAINGGAKVGPR